MSPGYAEPFVTTGAHRIPSPPQPVPTSLGPQKLTENSPSKEYERKKHSHSLPRRRRGTVQQEHIRVKGPPGTRWRTLSPNIRGRQRPLTNNISSFNLLFRLGRLQPQSAELLEAMAAVAEALSGFYHSRKFTKQNFVSKQAVLVRGLALGYCAGMGMPGTKRHLFLGGMAWASTVQATKSALQPGKRTQGNPEQANRP